MLQPLRGRMSMDTAAACRAAAVICLAVMSFFDIRDRSIPVWLLVIMTAAGALISADRNGGAALAYAADLIPAVMSLMVSLISHGGIGLGDVWCIAALGLIHGAAAGGSVCITALLLSVICSAGRLIKGARRITVPFTPYLLAAEIIMIAGGYI